MRVSPKTLIVAAMLVFLVGCGGQGSFSPDAGTYDDTQQVTISHSTADTLYVTTDGTTPNVNSEVYSSPIDVAVNTVIQVLPVNKGVEGALFRADYIINRPVSVRIEAEDYQRYVDTTVGNDGGVYRDDDVDIEIAEDTGGGFNVGWTDSGEWLEYDITLSAGTYDLSTRVASNVEGGNYSLLVDGISVGSDTLTTVSGWQSYQTRLIGKITLSAGMHTLRVAIHGGEVNLNWIELTPSAVIVEPPMGDIVPLYNQSTPLESVIVYDRGDALVTRISDRGRDRHAKENHFQAYDHYLTFYWEFRTAGIEIIDYVAKGGSSIRMNVKSQWRLHETQAENRWWYLGRNTLAEYCGNGVMNEIDSFHYYKDESWNCREGREIRIGDKLEFEVSQFLEKTLPRGRENYYGTTYLYIVGEGIVPWETTQTGPHQPGVDFQRDSIKIPEQAWLGGDTTIHAQETAEPDGHFMQMPTNLGFDNAQPFVLGRRLHHTSFLDGSHDENPTNGTFNEMAGKAGTHYVNQRCSECHERNGGATPASVGENLDKWVFKVADANGNPDPMIGRVLQPSNTGGVTSEGSVSIASWTESNGLRSPNYQFSNGTPALFSARIAPRLVGVGLLEAISESTILALADENDANSDGISGKAQLSEDPLTGETRLGRFGWKAATSSVKHQVAGALNTDMGVMTSVLPNPDCGSNQLQCGSSGVELADDDLNNLVKYISLLGIRPQRDYNDAEVLQGKSVFNSIGCVKCHTDTLHTSEFHPLAELRDQTIHPYTDLLLHDMGEGLADNLGEGQATGAEWRTTPLWGLGLAACVNGGVAGSTGSVPFGTDGGEFCTPVHSYLHDGRARSIEEAILWHGGESQASKQAYQSSSAGDKNALLRFLHSL